MGGAEGLRNAKAEFQSGAIGGAFQIPWFKFRFLCGLCAHFFLFKQQQNIKVLFKRNARRLLLFDKQQIEYSASQLPPDDKNYSQRIIARDSEP